MNIQKQHAPRDFLPLGFSFSVGYPLNFANSGTAVVNISRTTNWDFLHINQSLDRIWNVLFPLPRSGFQNHFQIIDKKHLFLSVSLVFVTVHWQPLALHLPCSAGSHKCSKGEKQEKLTLIHCSVTFPNSIFSMLWGKV